MNRFAKMKKERIYTLFETLSMKKERIYTLFETLSIFPGNYKLQVCRLQVLYIKKRASHVDSPLSLNSASTYSPT